MMYAKGTAESAHIRLPRRQRNTSTVSNVTTGPLCLTSCTMHSVILAALAALTIGCFGQDVVTFLENNPETAPFAQVLADYPELLADIQSTEDITLLVPSESALSELNNESTNETEIPQLLRYHVLRGSYSVSDLLSQTNPFIRTLMTDTGVTGGQRVQVSGDGETVNIFSGLNRNATIVAENVSLRIVQSNSLETLLTVDRGT